MAPADHPGRPLRRTSRRKRRWSVGGRRTAGPGRPAGRGAAGDPEPGLRGKQRRTLVRRRARVAGPPGFSPEHSRRRRSGAPHRRFEPLTGDRSRPRAPVASGPTPDHENYVEYLIQAGDGLTGLTLEQLGYKPRLEEDLTPRERHELETGDAEWMASVGPEQRDRSLFQAKPLAGALWQASAVLIDQLFEDITSPSWVGRPSSPCGTSSRIH